MSSQNKTTSVNKFELKTRDCLGRIGIFHTNHGDIETPTLLPVINPNDILISPREMRKLFGTQIIITNSYIIYKSANLRERALKDGLHKLLEFEAPIMTDSGTFQTHVYGDLDIDPLEIVEFQCKIGTDIGTILDVFTEPDSTPAEAEASVKTTLERAKASTEIVARNLQEPGSSGVRMALAGTVQGGLHYELRQACAEQLSGMACDVHPIGGVVPLMENYRFKELVEVVLASKKGLTPARPVHLFGAGHPMLFPLAVALGCDLFDSASYSKYAHDDRMMFPNGTRRLKDMELSPCNCPVCYDYSISELKSLAKAERVRKLAEHNLHVSFTELQKVKEAIYEGTLWELVEQRSHAHPYLLDALAPLRKRENLKFLERFEPLSRKRFFYLGKESLHHPAMYRYEQRFFKRYHQPTKKVLIGFELSSVPDRTYSQYFSAEISKVRKHCDAHFMVAAIFGPVPLELDEMYPVGQAVTPSSAELDSDPENTERIKRLMAKFSHVQKYELAVMWDGPRTLEVIKMGAGTEKVNTFDIDLLRIRSVANLQFGNNAGEILFPEGADVKLNKSKKTGKIRNVVLNGKHILSMRAQDGLFTLKAPGAEYLHKALKSPALRVIVDNETSEFNREGKSVFAKFVQECDPELRPMDEALVVNENDVLVAVGRALMNRDEMMAFDTGIAVKVREGVNI